MPTPDSEKQQHTLKDNSKKGDPSYFPDMVRYMDKCVGRLLATLESAGVAENTVVIFVADNGTDVDLVNRLKNGKAIKGGKGSMTDRGTRVPLIVRWPGQVQAGSVNEELVDFSDFLPTLCDLAGAPLPEQAIHGTSFLPQLLGKPGTPRRWVHIQDKGQRYLRTKDLILTKQGAMRPVTDLWRAPAPAFKGNPSGEASKVKQELEAAFEKLGN